MAKINEYVLGVLETGLVPELIRDGFRRSLDPRRPLRFTRRAKGCRQLIDVVNASSLMFRIRMGVHYSAYKARLGPIPRHLLPTTPYSATRRCQIENCLPELDGAGDCNWWYDGKRTNRTMADSMIHAWQNYGRIWFENRATLAGAADAAKRNRDPLRAAILFLAAKDRDSARAAFDEEILNCRFRFEERVGRIQRFARRHGIKVGPLTDDLKWKRMHDAWYSPEGWDACTNPYHAYEILERAHGNDWRKGRLTAIAMAGHGIEPITPLATMLMETAAEKADGLVSRPFLSFTNHPSFDSIARSIRQLTINERDASFTPSIPNPFISNHRSSELGPVFACERANIEPSQIATMKSHFDPYMHIIGDIYGNPFHSPRLDASWRTEAVISLARSIYTDNRFDLAPILADGLEEAGCHDSRFLDHLRQEAPHYRGCWVVDAILNHGPREAPPRPPSPLDGLIY